ncbi:hypothetical protein [Tepidibacter hydrothermalis]|uniref:Uncharacterized protein n=1 Tax=Tepidibacter hydrothermalis TaxID=3036126 RepID=A0ABY8EAM9_9FIRM|nr:hypothetical protein [Tepidibacter hydrothermalis]WFD09963.1 hypothetical protein P4S50_16535 [Tepidibacter hydrothermalis]
MIMKIDNGTMKELTAIEIKEVFEAINSNNLLHLELVPDGKGQPMVLVAFENNNEIQCYNFPATKGYEIHIINELLRSLDLDIKIEFQTYDQYSQLLNHCMDLVNTKKRVTEKVKQICTSIEHLLGGEDKKKALLLFMEKISESLSLESLEQSCDRVIEDLKGVC